MKISHISSGQDKILPSDYVVFEYTILCFVYPLSSFQATVHSLMTPKFDSGCFNEDNVKKHRFQIQIYGGSIKLSYYKPNTIVKCKNSARLWIKKTKYNRVKKPDFYYNVNRRFVLYTSYISLSFLFMLLI